MNLLIRCLQQPQRVGCVARSFKCTLDGSGAWPYVVVLSITGSALVYRAELDRLFATPRATLDEQATPMTADQLRAAARRPIPGWTVTDVHEGRYRACSGGPGGTVGRVGGGPGGTGRPRRLPDPTATIVFARGGETRERLFNPYTGADLGDSTTRGQWFLLWVTVSTTTCCSSGPMAPGGMGCSV